MICKENLILRTKVLEYFDLVSGSKNGSSGSCLR